MTRPCIYMSKQIMSYIWGWDNIFNTLVLAKGNPQLAFDQIAIFFDHQSETGMFPDCIDDFATLWTCTKLPIYGWAFLKMLENGALTQGQIRQAYGPLKRWTDWWFNFRDSDRDGIPEYIHGNESGWDNSTIFMVQPPVETADLTAFLLIQMEVLSKFAAILGMEFEKECWDERLKLTQARFYGHFERGGRLVPVRSGSHEPICSQSLLQFIPLILGGRLPRHIRENMINDLKTGGYITQYGLATESVDSPFYGADSYWRGPIWPSATMLLIDALHDCAEEELAVELARKYCDLCVREGFPENFDALAGNALRDKTYSWAAAAFLYLAEKYLR